MVLEDFEEASQECCVALNLSVAGADSVAEIATVENQVLDRAYGAGQDSVSVGFTSVDLKAAAIHGDVERVTRKPQLDGATEVPGRDRIERGLKRHHQSVRAEFACRSGGGRSWTAPAAQSQQDGVERLSAFGQLVNQAGDWREGTASGQHPGLFELSQPLCQHVLAQTR